MTDTEKFFAEIVDLHVEIERWFTGSARPLDLVQLLEHFSPDFCMISTRGTAVGKEGVGELFARLHGKRPELRITVDEMQISHRWPGAACVTYRETHADAGGIVTARRSTAVLETAAGGVLRWMHLHETPIVA